MFLTGQHFNRPWEEPPQQGHFKKVSFVNLTFF